MPVNAEVGRSGPEPRSGASADAPAGQMTVAGPSPATGGAVSLRVLDLTLSFADQAILSNVSAEVRAGAVTALTGPIGSGKSTLLPTLNRMNDTVSGYRHAGDVLLDKRSI
jgi:phosphate transport system ATP-binding protein